MEAKMPSHSRVPVVVLMVAFLIQPIGAAPGFAQVAGLAAPGAPYVDCTQAAAKYERLSRGLGPQQDAIERTRAWLEALQQDRIAGTKEARDNLMARSADKIKSQAAEELDTLKKLQEKALRLAEPADQARKEARLKWLGRVSTLDDSISKLLAIPDAFRSGYEYGLAVQRQSRTVAEQLTELNKVFVESGLAEEVGADLAKAGGPAGVALFRGSLLLLDHLLADMNDFDRQLEEGRAADTYNNLTHSLSEVEGKMANLVQDCPAQFGKDTSTQSPATASTSLTPPTPPAPPTEEQPAVRTAKKSGGSGGKAVVALAGVGLAVGGAIYAGKTLANLANTAAGACASNRTCIVSVMGHGCDCAGSATGGCDWSGPTVGEGGGCGAGAPCASGLSCNNGRCEGPDGRCPF
jgi:hypothetical protein